MAINISGTVFYQQDSYAGNLTARVEIVTNSGQFLEKTNKVPGVAITLYNRGTQKGITVTSKSDGTFSFTDVPEGNYHLMETFGASVHDQGTGTASFTNAISMSDPPITADPTVDYIKKMGFVTYGASKIVSLSENVKPFTITSASTNTGYQFYDAPRIVIPLVLRAYSTVGSDLIKSVAGGTFGRENPGTPAGTSSTTCVYTKYSGTGNYTADVYDSEIYDNYIKYSSVAPDGGFYTICNIANKHTFNNKWFDTPGRTQGDETGRFLIVNGDKEGKYFFKEKVSITPNKEYLFSMWIMNIFRMYVSGIPLFEVDVKDLQGQTLFRESISADEPLNVTRIPTWKQIGAIIPSSVVGTSTELIIECKSMGPEVSGNDYCIDDISLYELEACALKPTLTKAVNKTRVILNEEFSYSTTIYNGTASYIFDLVFTDPIPSGTSLKDGVITVLVKSQDQDLVEFPITVDEAGLTSGINISEELGEHVSFNQAEYASTPYFTDLRDGRIPCKVSVVLTYEVIYNKPDEIGADNSIHNTAKYEYSSPLDRDNVVPRILISNEVVTSILSPILSYEKELSVIENGVEYILPNGGGVLCGQLVAYRIVVTNTGTVDANGVEISDVLNDTNLVPVYSESEDCANGVSYQEISPIFRGENFLPCSDITKIDGSIYNIKISNLTVPTAIIDNGVLVPGKCVIRIYCKTNCNGV